MLPVLTSRYHQSPNFLKRALSCVLFGVVLLHFSCTTAPNNKDDDAARLLSRAMDQFNYDTFSAQAAISKVYPGKPAFEDEMRLFTKTNGTHKVFLIQIKPTEKHKGKAILVEQEGDKLISAHTYLSGDVNPIRVDPNQMSTPRSEVVIGGLSFLDIQMLQGVRRFKEVRNAGNVQINSQDCSHLAVKFPEGSTYDHAQFFVSQKGLLVLVKVFDDRDRAIKEISFNEFESVLNRAAIKELVVRDQIYNYTSTFQFKNIRINNPIGDSVFSLDHIKTAWEDQAD